MKILFVTGSRSTRGGHLVLTALVSELKKIKYKVQVVTIASNEHEDDPGLENIWRGIPLKKLRKVSAESADEKDWLKIHEVANYLKKNARNFNIIIIDGWHMVYAAVLAGVKDKSIQLTQSYPAFIPDIPAKIWRAAYFDLLGRVGMKRIAVSYYLSRKLKEEYGHKSKIMHPYIADEYMQSLVVYRDNVKLKLVASASTWRPDSKGLAFLIRSLSSFSGFPFELTLVSGEKMDEVPRSNFPIHITNAKNPFEMANILSGHDVYLSVSTQEAFHLSLAEAMALGMPCVALDSGGNTDYIKPGKDIFLAKNEKVF